MSAGSPPNSDNITQLESADLANRRDVFMAAVDRCYNTIRAQVLEKSDEVAHFFVDACHKLDKDHASDYFNYIDDNVATIQAFVQNQFLQLQNDIRHLRGIPAEELHTAVEQKLSRLLSQPHDSYAAFRSTLSNQNLPGNPLERSEMPDGFQIQESPTFSTRPSNMMPSEIGVTESGAMRLSQPSRESSHASPRLSQSSRSSSLSAQSGKRGDATGLTSRSSVTNQQRFDIRVSEEYTEAGQRSDTSMESPVRVPSETRSSGVRFPDIATSLPRRESSQSLPPTESVSESRASLPKYDSTGSLSRGSAVRSRMSVPPDESIRSLPQSSRQSLLSLQSETGSLREATSQTSQPYGSSPSLDSVKPRPSIREATSQTSGSVPSSPSMPAHKTSRESADSVSKRRKSTISEETCPDEEDSPTDTCETETLPSIGSLSTTRIPVARTSSAQTKPDAGRPSQRQTPRKRSSRQSVRSRQSDPLQASSSSSSLCEDDESLQSVKTGKKSFVARRSVESYDPESRPYIHVHSRIEHPRIHPAKTAGQDLGRRSREQSVEEAPQSLPSNVRRKPSKGKPLKESMKRPADDHIPERKNERTQSEDSVLTSGTPERVPGIPSKGSVDTAVSPSVVSRIPKQNSQFSRRRSSVGQSPPGSRGSRERNVSGSHSKRSTQSRSPEKARSIVSSRTPHGAKAARTKDSSVRPVSNKTVNDPLRSTVPSGSWYSVQPSSRALTQSGTSKPSLRSAKSEVTQIPSDISRESVTSAKTLSRVSKGTVRSEGRSKPSERSVRRAAARPSKHSDRAGYASPSSSRSVRVHITASTTSHQSHQTDRSPIGHPSASHRSERSAVNAVSSKSQHSALTNASASTTSTQTERSRERREKDQYSARLTPSQSRLTVEHTVSHMPSNTSTKAPTSVSHVSHRTARSERQPVSSANLSQRTERSAYSVRQPVSSATIPRTERSHRSERSADSTAKVSGRSDPHSVRTHHSARTMETRPTASRHTARTAPSKHSIGTIETKPTASRHTASTDPSQYSVGTIKTRPTASRHTARTAPSKHLIGTIETKSTASRHTARTDPSQYSAGTIKTRPTASRNTDRTNPSKHSIRTTTTASGRTPRSDHRSQSSVAGGPSGHSVRSITPAKTVSHISGHSDRPSKATIPRTSSKFSARSISPVRTTSHLSRHSDRPSKASVRTAHSKHSGLGGSPSGHSGSSRQNFSSPSGSGVVGASSHSSERSFYSEVHSVHSEIERSASNASFAPPSNKPSTLRPNLLHPNMAYGVKSAVSHGSNIHSTGSNISPQHSQFSWTFSGASDASSRSGESGESDHSEDHSLKFSRTSLANKSSLHSQVSMRSQQSQTESEYTGTDRTTKSDDDVSSDASDRSQRLRKKKRKKQQK